MNSIQSSAPCNIPGTVDKLVQSATY